MIRTVKSTDKKHRWQIKVVPVRRGFNGSFRDDSEGKWSPWKRVIHGNNGSWTDAESAVRDMLKFVGQ